MTNLIALVICLYILHLNRAKTTTRRCRDDLGHGVLEEHCCDNHEERNSTCVECEDGFKSDIGETCYKCPYGSFGRKCGDICNCDKHERCHHVNGCLEFSTEFPSTSSELKSGFISTAAKPSIPSPSYTGVLSTAAKLSIPSPSYTGNMDDRLIIYIICTSGITFVLTLSIVSMNRCRKRNRRNARNLVENRDGNEENAVELNHIVVEYESVYDTVDESQMVDMPIHTDDQNNQNDGESTDSSESSILPAPDDLGYLNPYQPIVPDIEPHEYCSKVEGMDKCNRFQTNTLNRDELLCGSYELSVTELQHNKIFQEFDQENVFEQAKMLGNFTLKQNIPDYMDMESPENHTCQSFNPLDSHLDTFELNIVNSTAEVNGINQSLNNFNPMKKSSSFQSHTHADFCISAFETRNKTF